MATTIPRAGVKQLNFGSTRMRVRSDVAVNPGGTQKNPGQGLDGHRYFTVAPREASIGVTVTVASADEFLALQDREGETTTLQLRDDGIVILEDSSMSLEGEINIDEGSVSVKFIGSTLRWLKP